MVASSRGRFQLASPAARGLLGLLLAALCPAGSLGAEPAALPGPGRVVEHQLAGGEVHRYRIERSAVEELWITVDQDGVDVTVTVVGADGEPRITVDSPSGLWGPEWLLLEAGEPVDGLLEIRALTPGAAPGRYRLRVESRFPAHGTDRRRRAAERAVTAAGRLHHEGARETRREARGRYREALAGWRSLGRSAEATRTLYLLGVLHRQLDEPREALALLRLALAGWQGLEDRRGEAQALGEIATTSLRLGETGGVEALYREALTLWRELGDLHGQARSLNYLGLVRARTAPHRALEPYRNALELYRRLGDARWEGVLLNNLGGAHDLLGEPRRAREHYRAALEIQRRLGNLRYEAALWNNIASVDRRSGRLQEALEGYRASLAARRELGDHRGEGRVLNNLGLTLLSLGEPSRAREVLRDALALRRETEDRRGEAITLHNLGLAHADLGEWDAALDLEAEALALHRVLRDRDGEAATLLALGWVAGEAGRPRTGRRHLESALNLFDEIGNPWLRASAEKELGQVLATLGEGEAAVAAIEGALEHYRATGDELGQSDALLTLARAERTLEGRLEAAYSHAVAGLDLLETIRAGVDHLGLRTSFLAHRDEAFELAVDLAMELERRQPSRRWAGRALAISERGRARSFLDLLEESGAGLGRGVDTALLERQRELLERLNTKVARHRRQLDREGPSAASERWADEVRAIRAALEEVDTAMRRQSPRWDALVRPRSLDAEAIRALLDPGTTLLEYSLGEERSFLWVVTAAGVDGYELPGRAEIEAAARRLYEELRIYDPRSRSTAAAAARLGEMLLAPAVQHLRSPGTQRLAVVADGALHYVPFAVLPHPADGEPLVVHHELVALPSASALGVQRELLADRPVAERTLAVLADPVFDDSDPRLPGSAVPLTVARADAAYREAPSGRLRLGRLAWSRWEAEAITAHAGPEEARLTLGFEADLDAVRGGVLAGYRIVHLATHGIVDGEHPELSALILSRYDAEGRPRQGFLRLPEIYRLELDAELVVLSGCQTALGQQIRGEGLVGLTRGFLAAGARRLVASLWRVQDRSVAELMNLFYEHLLADEPMPPAAALRAAQLEMLSDPELADPFHWAAFAVYGDWR